MIRYLTIALFVLLIAGCERTTKPYSGISVTPPAGYDVATDPQRAPPPTPTPPAS